MDPALQINQIEWVTSLRDLKQAKKRVPKFQNGQKSIKSDNRKEDLGVKSSVTIRDLCADDRRRIADLIRELAEANTARQTLEEQLKQHKAEYLKELKAAELHRLEILAERDQAQHDAMKAQQLLLSWQEGVLSRLPSTDIFSARSTSTPMKSDRPITEKIDCSIAVETDLDLKLDVQLPSPRNKSVQVNFQEESQSQTVPKAAETQIAQDLQHQLEEREQDLLRRERAQLESMLAAQQATQAAAIVEMVENRLAISGLQPKPQSHELQTSPLLQLSTNANNSQLLMPNGRKTYSIHNEEQTLNNFDNHPLTRSPSESLLELVDLLESSKLDNGHVDNQIYSDTEDDVDDAELFDGIFFVR